MKYFVFPIVFILLVSFTSFTNVENHYNNDNSICQPIENLYAAYDSRNGNLQLKWDDVKSDITYFVIVNGVMYQTAYPNLVIPTTPQFSTQGIHIEIRKSCQTMEEFSFNASLRMECNGGLEPGPQFPNSLKPDDKGGCCIIATSGNINVHSPCSVSSSTTD